MEGIETSALRVYKSWTQCRGVSAPEQNQKASLIDQNLRSGSRDCSFAYVSIIFPSHSPRHQSSLTRLMDFVHHVIFECCRNSRRGFTESLVVWKYVRSYSMTIARLSFLLWLLPMPRLKISLFERLEIICSCLESQQSLSFWIRDIYAWEHLISNETWIAMHVEEEEGTPFSRLNHLSHCIHMYQKMISSPLSITGCWDVLPFNEINNGLFQDSPSRPFHWWALFVVEGHFGRLITLVSPPVARTQCTVLTSGFRIDWRPAIRCESRSTNPIKTFLTTDIAIWHLLTVNNILTSMCE